MKYAALQLHGQKTPLLNPRSCCLLGYFGLFVSLGAGITELEGCHSRKMSSELLAGRNVPKLQANEVSYPCMQILTPDVAIWLPATEH